MDLGQQAGEVAELHVVDRALDGATARVPEDDDELRTHLDGVFEAAELVVVHDVAGDAHAEHVADPLIEDDLDGRARVHAAEHRRERELSRRRGRLPWPTSRAASWRW